MKEYTWHVSRDTIARVKLQGPVLVNSAWASIFDKQENVTQIVVPTELAIAVDLAEIKRRLISWYKKELGEEPNILLTVYRYPAGVSVERATPIGVGLAAFQNLDVTSLAPGRVAPPLPPPEDPEDSAVVPD